MWWYDGLFEIEPTLADEHVLPASPEHVMTLMRLHLIAVRDDVEGCEGPVVELGFWAAFEQEHKVSVLTNCENVLGTGYESDVTAYGFEYE